MYQVDVVNFSLLIAFCWLNYRMNKSKQTTLFQSWGGTSATAASKTSAKVQQRNVQPNSSRSNSKHASASHFKAKSSVIDLCQDSDDDADLLAAMEESLRYADGNNTCDIVAANGQCASTNRVESDCLPVGMAASHLPSYSVLSLNKMKTSSIEDLPGFDCEAGRIWIYPTNYPVREYQFCIVEQALMRNTMVTLPTGLGKTFVAAVVMFNFYRWYPTSKIVFMAPTKPLVAQQIEACHAVVGIPMEDTAEMTGM
jgi:Type III restriction enzyme, res subunit